MHLVKIAITFHCLQLKFLAVLGSLCHEEKRSQRGFALVNATYLSKELKRYPDCLFLCVYDVRCMSFNFWWEKRRCDLNSKTKDQSCDGCFLKEASSTYMEMLRSMGSKASVTSALKSCSDLRKSDPVKPSGSFVIDPDGEGGLEPFTVNCDMSDKNGVGVTVISHDSESRTLVDGYKEPGTYSRDINYTGASLPQLASLTRVSLRCEQFIKYECHGSRLLRSGMAWWVSRNSSKMTYWGGASPGSGKCACGMTNSCASSSYPACNCDKNDRVWRNDSGLLTDKAHLPVAQLRFGDTGYSAADKGYHTLGKFKCFGSIQ